MFSVKRSLKIFLSVAFFAVCGSFVATAAPSAADQRLLKKAEGLFRQHGKYCVCEDCRTIKDQLKSRGLMAGRLGEKTGGKPIFEGPGITRPIKPSRPVPVSPPVPAPVAPRPVVGSTNGRSVVVTRGRPLHPFRNIVFPPIAALPEPVVSTPPQAQPQAVRPASKPEGRPTGHGVRIADPRPRLVARISSAPQRPSSLSPPPSGVPPTPPPTLPPGISRPAGLTGFPGRPVTIPGRPVSAPSLPGRPIPAPSTSLPGRAVIPSPPSGVGAIPGTPLPGPAASGQNLEAKIQTLIRQGVPPDAINRQTGIVRMNLQGQYLNASGSVIFSRRPRR